MKKVRLIPSSFILFTATRILAQKQQEPGMEVKARAEGVPLSALLPCQRRPSSSWRPRPSSSRTWTSEPTFLEPLQRQEREWQPLCCLSLRRAAVSSPSPALQHQRGLQGRRTTSSAQDPDLAQLAAPVLPGPLRRQGGPGSSAAAGAGWRSKRRSRVSQGRTQGGLGKRLQKQTGGLGERPSWPSPIPRPFYAKWSPARNQVLGWISPNPSLYSAEEHWIMARTSTQGYLPAFGHIRRDG